VQDVKITRSLIIDTLKAQREALLARVKPADRRAHRLTQASYAYDEATVATQAPEECARLERLIRLSNRANEAVDVLQDRARHLESAIQSLESDEILSRPAQKAPL
jgi:hypothetical protein